jgi:hypothetical protein
MRRPWPTGGLSRQTQTNNSAWLVTGPACLRTSYSPFTYKRRTKQTALYTLFVRILCYVKKLNFILVFKLSPSSECCIISFWVIPRRLNFICRRFWNTLSYEFYVEQTKNTTNYTLTCTTFTDCVSVIAVCKSQ